MGTYISEDDMRNTLVEDKASSDGAVQDSKLNIAGGKGDLKIPECFPVRLKIETMSSGFGGRLTQNKSFVDFDERHGTKHRQMCLRGRKGDERIAKSI